MSFGDKASNFVKGIISSIQKEDVQLITEFLEKQNLYYEKCNFGQDLGFVMEFTKMIQYNESLGEKFTQLFNVDNHMCRVKINMFSDEKRLKWKVSGQEVCIGMSLKNISKLQNQFLELWIDKSTLAHMQIIERENIGGTSENFIEQAKLVEKNDESDGFVDIIVDNSCCVCFDNNIEEILECNHSFCSDCLKTWFHVKEKKCCPLCRYSYGDKSGEQIDKSNYKIVGLKIIEENYARNKNAIIEMMDQYFLMPEFSLLY